MEPLLKLNAKAPMQDPRVPQLRERLGLAGDPADLKYDAKLAEEVKKFQRGADLPASGNLDAKTIKELNGPARGQQIDLVVANMERWRWLRAISASPIRSPTCRTSRSRWSRMAPWSGARES